MGVLMALAAQQVVETWNWRAVVCEERAVLRAEVKDNLDAIQDRLWHDKCLDRRLGELGTVLERRTRGEPLGLRGPVGLPLPSNGAKGAWNIALAGQGLAHMPHSEQLGFSNAYANFENWDRIRQDERDAWLMLGVLDRAEGMGEGDWVSVRQAYARALAARARIASAGRFILRTASMGQRPFALTVARQRFERAPYGREICARLI